MDMYFLFINIFINHKNIVVHMFWSPWTSPDRFKATNKLSNVKNPPDAATLALHAFD